MRCARLWVTLAMLGSAGVAQAYPNDVSYSGLAQWQDGCDPYGSAPCTPVKDASGRVQGDQRAFDGLAEELGVILAPRDVGPAHTGGQSGFDMAVEITGHRINNQHDYWARSLERSARKDHRDVVYPAMGTMQAWLKKGLPYSFQIAAGGTYLLESRIMAVGVQGKWTLNEGFFWFPDVALTVGANKTLCLGLPSSIPLGDERANGTTRNSCANDLDLVTATMGAVVSKTFAVVGTFTVSPYAGWQKIFVHSFSPFVDGDPTTNDKTGETFKFRDYKVWGDFVGQECGEADVSTTRCFFDAQGAPQLLNLVSHRNKLYAGLRLNFSIMEATVQGEVTHIRGTAWSVGNTAFAGDTLRLDGLGMPDLHLGATFRLGILF